MVESGKFYATFIDPVLAKIREKVATHFEPQKKIIDIACGTGAQAFKLAEKAQFVVGVDFSDSMIKKANQIKAKNGFENSSLRFVMRHS